MKPACIIYYHGNEWEGVPGRQAKLMEAMSHHLPVIFLDAGRDARFRVTLSRPLPGVTVVRGLVVILRSLVQRRWYSPARIVARLVLARLIRPYRQVIFWGAENWWQLERFVPHHVFVHDSIDPCFVEEHAAAFAEREKALQQKAAVVLCTAETLLAEAKKINPQSYLVPNACAKDDFRSPGEKLPLPMGIPEVPPPVVGYLGTIDSRIDVATALHTATQLKECSFVFAGPIVPGLDEALRPLRSLANVFFVGPQYGVNARAVAQTFDVGLIPFLPGVVSDALNPVKMYTYLAAGTPVVSTWIHECVRHRQWMRAAKTPEEFAAAVRQALRSGVEERARLIYFARQNTWAHRAADTMRIFAQVGIVAGT